LSHSVGCIFKLASPNPQIGETLGTSHTVGRPQLGVVRAADTDAEVAGRRRELFDLYRAARAAQRKAELADEIDLAWTARSIAADAMARLRLASREAGLRRQIEALRAEDSRKGS
jgi:hypothetical protein